MKMEVEVVEAVKKNVEVIEEVEEKAETVDDDIVMVKSKPNLKP